jgi:hypothetical protein
MRNKHELTDDQKLDLEFSIANFQTWLQKDKKLQLLVNRNYEKLSFPRPTSADWIMRVKGTEVQFNTYGIAKCTFAYFRMIVLHECFHLFVQGVPNKSDAKRFRDDFGDVFMKLLDIEADYFTAMFHKEILRVPLVDIYALYYEGSRLFGDPLIRPPKVERFIGTVLSVANAYFRNPGVKKVKENDLYLPNLVNIPTEDSIHILIAHRDHFSLGQIQADIHDFSMLKKCYTGRNDAGVREYVETLVTFAAKALSREIPSTIYKQFTTVGASVSVKATITSSSPPRQKLVERQTRFRFTSKVAQRKQDVLQRDAVETFNGVRRS